MLTKSHVVNLEIHFTTHLRPETSGTVRPETSGTLERGERLCLKKDFETKVVNLEIHFTTGNCVVKVRAAGLRTSSSSASGPFGLKKVQAEVVKWISDLEQKVRRWRRWRRWSRINTHTPFLFPVSHTHDTR